MDWKDIAGAVSKAAPILGTLLGGPAGGAIGSAIAATLGTANTPAAVQQAITENPETALKLATLEAEHRTRLEELITERDKAELAAVAQTTSDVNQTMRAESVSERWPTYAWRPAIGFAVALAVVLSVLAVFGAYAALLIWGQSEGLAQLPGILAAVAGIIAVVSPILGIASWFRGRMQADSAMNGGKG